ncbi:hypothetical protein HZS_7823 [Henneguya salminicola]|uniref:ER membrane protein complex subunit 7 (Trinotate prediction) n=1 Tax=Henneguya salminicola TaxID=69463 RepID=A0A6G3MDN6_HENSL|nr:hypothetical protein HZS_7823 [Henneguya salminicola]
MLCFFTLIFILLVSTKADEEYENLNYKNNFSIHGKVMIDDDDFDWLKTTRIFLGNNLDSMYLNIDGTFIFENVPSGYYLLSVVSPNHYFSPILVKIDSEGAAIGRYINDLDISFSSPFLFQSKIRSSYTKNQPKYNFFSILSNPLIIFAVVSLILVKAQGSISNFMENNNLNANTEATATKKSIQETISYVFES